jgi:hypothetical protein
MEEPGYWQSAVTTELARYAFQSGAEWVLPFDADEFLDVEGKEHLQYILNKHRDPLGFWRWRHVVPTAGVIEFGSMDWSAPKLIANPTHAPGNGGKVVLHKTVYQKLPNFRLGSGNHLLHGAPFAKGLRGNELGTLWHLPVRSYSQITQKLRRDIASHSDGKSDALPELQGAALLKKNLLNRITNESNRIEVIQRMGLGYGEIGIRCFDDNSLLTKAIELSPRLPLNVSFVATYIQNVNEPHISSFATQTHTKYSLARAKLLADTVDIQSATAANRILHSVELILVKFFTPGLRLARFLMTRFVTIRLKIPVR